MRSCASHPTTGGRSSHRSAIKPQSLRGWGGLVRRPPGLPDVQESRRRALLPYSQHLRPPALRPDDQPAAGARPLGAGGRRSHFHRAERTDMAYTLPDDVDRRPVAIDGAGTLGRRIATVYAAGGSDVRIFDMSAEQREAAKEYVKQHIDDTRRTLGLAAERTGTVEAADNLEGAVRGAWMIIEAVPETGDLKISVFGDLDRLAEPDAILATNSSSLPSSQMIGKVEHAERVLNTHYQQPPELNSVELMSCGRTDDGVIDALMAKIPQYGLKPFRVRRESDGFIFNRIWASIKRECLMVVEEGVATPEDVDEMWTIFTKPGIPPFRLMDRVGLDVVLNIEEHYASVRPGLPERAEPSADHRLELADAVAEGEHAAVGPERHLGVARGHEPLGVDDPAVVAAELPDGLAGEGAG